MRYIPLLVVLVLDIVLLVFRQQIALAYINAQGGCYPWSPAEVEYHDGMTLCPGQSARMRLKIIIPADKSI